MPSPPNHGRAVSVLPITRLSEPRTTLFCPVTLLPQPNTELFVPDTMLLAKPSAEQGGGGLNAFATDR